MKGYGTMRLSWREKPHLAPACLINGEASAATVTERFAQLEAEKQAEPHDRKVEKGTTLDF